MCRQYSNLEKGSKIFSFLYFNFSNNKRYIDWLKIS
ncbi:hypothetical protein wcw_0767 [Waddlia chondrophila WSU 86-1044]|uniref:Uncharacterized protein n=1 Tax=Waddlia chondrophila (strain ATCC VR-1470 / WSU 86-1044) TaxID=716544 RepID=D6YVH3_WADCW|nr:hypothetical protein wcw_0767 [Waddlia chondrophila WSU 86-1044]